MASRNERYQERLAARLRGAGARKVANPGFDLDLLATPESAPPATAPQLPAITTPTLLAETPTTRRTSLRNARTNNNTNSDESRQSVFGGNTPQTRAKRRRQPSPDKFLNTPEAKAVQQGQQTRVLVNGDRETRRQARLRGAGARTVADAGFDIGGLLESPASPAKRRRIETPRRESEPERMPESQPKPVPEPILPKDEKRVNHQNGTDGLVEEQHDDMAVPMPEPEVEQAPILESEPVLEVEPEESEEAPAITRRSPRQTRKKLLTPPPDSPVVEKQTPVAPLPPPTASPAVEKQTPYSRPPRRSLGKKPAAPNISEGEEREAEEAERAALERVKRAAQADAAKDAQIARVAAKKARAKEKAEEEARLAAEAEAEVEAEAQEKRAHRAKAKGKEKARQQLEPEPEPEASEDEVEVEEIDESQAAEEDEVTPPPRVKKTRKPSAQKRQDEDYAVEEDNAPRQRQPKDGVEILIHRFDIGAIAPPPKSNRKGVNPADIVYTLLIEQIDRVYPTLQTKVEKEAVEIFKEELAAKLRQLTDSIENYLNLQLRNRQAIKRKLHLQQEILEIKKQRQLVAVQQDEVRNKYENASKKNQVRQRVGSAYEGLTDLVERAAVEFADLPPSELEASAESGLDALIYRLAPLVTGGGADGSGMLGKIVQFNRELERLTELLKEHNATSL